MARGLPDYYNPDTIVSQRLANVDELATLLRGIASLDNRGRTLFFDNFKEGVSGWRLASGGDGADPVADDVQALVPPNNMKMDAGTDAGAGWSDAVKHFRLFTQKKVGFEMSCFWGADHGELRMYITYRPNATDYYRGRLWINHDDKKIYIADGAVKTSLLDLTDSMQDSWLPIKLVVDFDNLEYDRLIVGQVQYDISEYSLETGAQVAEGMLSYGLSADAVDDGTNVAYVGHATGTIDEP